MARFLHYIYSADFRRFRRPALAFSWLLGLLCGVWLFRTQGSSLRAFFPDAASGSVTLFSLLLSGVVPLLMSAVAVYCASDVLIFGICFLKAMLYAYLGCGVLAAFAQAGWLVRGLLLFTDTLGCAVLYWFWDRIIRDPQAGKLQAVLCCAAVLLVIASADLQYFAPLLRNCFILQKG